MAQWWLGGGMTKLAELWSRWKVWWLSAAAGAGLGCLFRLFISLGNHFSDRLDSAAWVFTVAYLAVVPAAMGYVTARVYLHRTEPERVSVLRCLFLPWLSVLIAMVFFIMVAWEGTICIVLAAPILLAFSLIGGLIAWLLWKSYRNRTPGTFSAIALPLVLILVESHLPSPYEIRTVNTEIFIHAPSSVVWSNIKSVRAIAPQELPGSWVGRIGFPRPIAATLSHEGVGGVRQASFTGGLVFTETVNRWDREQDLRFSIHANTDSIPTTTLDEHVTIGGTAFDVLDGEYRLEQKPDGVLLHLSSRERLSTHLNPYAALWTDAIMRSIQNEILVVVRDRCERQAGS
jgi:hypothetical protein